MEWENQIICGDCLDIARQLPDASIDLVVTSPPYAEQRAKQYGGIPENLYPYWTAEWMHALRRALKPQGSVAIVIRSHIKNGQISDYVLRTRLAVRAHGWKECEELIWIKPDSPPLGSLYRPRRAWESILWFSKTGKPFCDPKANGQESDRVGFETTKGVGDYKQGVSKARKGIARCRDYVAVGTGKVDKSKENIHPAQYPEDLVIWLIKLLSPEGATVLDPFIGSGTTAVACKRLGRKFVGIEIDSDYCEVARNRLQKID